MINRAKRKHLIECVARMKLRERTLRPDFDVDPYSPRFILFMSTIFHRGPVAPLPLSLVSGV